MKHQIVQMVVMHFVFYTNQYDKLLVKLLMCINMEWHINIRKNTFYLVFRPSKNYHRRFFF
jgi:hypothetical protein